MDASTLSPGANGTNERPERTRQDQLPGAQRLAEDLAAVLAIGVADAEVLLHRPRSRDDLDGAELVRAALESLADNTVDAVVAPSNPALLCLFLSIRQPAVPAGVSVPIRSTGHREES